MSLEEKSNEPKRHHYIPRYLLRNFCENHESIFYLDREFKYISNSVSTKSVAYEYSLYTHKDDNYEVNFMKDFDSKSSILINKIINNKVLPSVDPFQRELKKIIAIQFLRIPSICDYIHFVKMLLIKAYGEEILGDIKGEKTISQYDEMDDKLLFMYFVAEVYEEVLSKIINMQTFLLKAEGASFILSDNPVVRINRLREEHSLGNILLDDPGVQFIMPISKDYAILLSNYISNKYTNIYDFDEINSLQTRYSQKYIYSGNKYMLEKQKDSIIENVSLKYKLEKSCEEMEIKKMSYEKNKRVSIISFIKEFFLFGRSEKLKKCFSQKEKTI